MTEITDITDTTTIPSRAPASPLARTAPFLWSVRREIWEHKSVWTAPVAAAGFVMLGFLLALSHSANFNFHSDLDPASQGDLRILPYGIGAFVVIVTSFVTAFFYCLSALHGERRDRSILFWKSLPVSDLTTVLAKAVVPMVIIPLTAFAVIVALQIAMMTLATAHLVITGQSVMALWTEANLAQMWGILAYGLIVLALWYAPIWGWVLLVSGWARGATFLWSLGPWLALCVVEKIGLGTDHVGAMLKDRLFGGVAAGFRQVGEHGPVMDMAQIDLAGFLATPGLWIGLAFAAAFIALAIRQRRHRGPI